jgi:UDP:flavonoid glycosyltransferase YjiC (YdhE family)
MVQRLRDCWEACRDADAIVVSILPYLFGYAIAEKLQVPLVRAFYYPVSPTREYAPEFLPRWVNLGGRFNLAAYQAQRQVVWQIVRPWLNRAARTVLGSRRFPLFEPFSELDRRQLPLLYCYSSAVAPQPSDWGQWIDVTGYWFLDRPTSWSPPPQLTEFLEQGPPPVYVGGFGSMSNRDPVELARTVARAVAMSGRRALVLRGWGGLKESEFPREILPIDWVPFDWLFPRVSAVIHHGGAGTTAASLRAGLPTIIVPYFLDQFFWARRVQALGVGPTPILRKHLTAEALAGAIKEATNDSGMRDRAAALGARIRAENGVARAVDTFQRHFGAGQSVVDHTSAAR